MVCADGRRHDHGVHVTIQHHLHVVYDLNRRELQRRHLATFWREVRDVGDLTHGQVVEVPHELRSPIAIADHPEAYLCPLAHYICRSLCVWRHIRAVLLLCRLLSLSHMIVLRAQTPTPTPV